MSTRRRPHDDEEKKEPAALHEKEESSEMRGVHATTHIMPNTVCMAIPRRCLITVEMGQATPIGQAILQSDLDLDAPKHIFLMIYILWDRKVNGEASFFHPYYEILPQTLSNMPIFWTPEELAYLEGSYLLHQIADRNQAIADDYHSICAVAPALQQIATLEEFKWARMCVCSRNFGLCIDGHRTSALVPHADMLNHFRPRETKWTFDEERQAFTITTLQHIPAGAQVYDSYGQKCNHRFLLNYGFAVEDNREIDGHCPNEVPIELFIDPEDQLFTEKLEFWTRGEVPASVGGDSASLLTQSILAHAMRTAEGQRWWPSGAPVVKRIRICVSNNDNTRVLFSLLRTLACNEAELKAITTPLMSHSSGSPPAPETSMTRTLFGLDTAMRSPHPSFYHHHYHHHNPHASMVLTGTPTSTSYYRSCRDIRHPISLRNERAAMQLLLEIVGRHLAAYPTTLAQDVADLMDEQAFPRFSNRRHAKIQVRGEKEVLHHFAHWARTALEVLDVVEEELKEERGNVSMEVHLTKQGGTRVVQESRPTFETLIRQMEDDCDVGIHHTIVRYCADVLGSLRREETRNIKKLRAFQKDRPGGGGSNNKSGSAPGGFRL